MQELIYVVLWGYLIVSALSVGHWALRKVCPESRSERKFRERQDKLRAEGRLI